MRRKERVSVARGLRVLTVSANTRRTFDALGKNCLATCSCGILTHFPTTLTMEQQYSLLSDGAELGESEALHSWK